jgi:hypothetical protein
MSRRRILSALVAAPFGASLTGLDRRAAVVA